MESIRRRNARRGVMPYAYGNSIPDFIVITYQSFGLDRKKTVRKRSFFLVRLKGLEPSRRGHQILSLARLPIPPQAHIKLSLSQPRPRNGLKHSRLARLRSQHSCFCAFSNSLYHPQGALVLEAANSTTGAYF